MVVVYYVPFMYFILPDAHVSYNLISMATKLRRKAETLSQKTVIQFGNVPLILTSSDRNAAAS